jgi:hypothetical protein
MRTGEHYPRAATWQLYNTQLQPGGCEVHSFRSSLSHSVLLMNTDDRVKDRHIPYKTGTVPMITVAGPISNALLVMWPGATELPFLYSQSLSIHSHGYEIAPVGSLSHKSELQPSKTPNRIFSRELRSTRNLEWGTCGVTETEVPDLWANYVLLLTIVPRRSSRLPIKHVKL